MCGVDQGQSEPASEFDRNLGQRERMKMNYVSSSRLQRKSSLRKLVNPHSIPAYSRRERHQNANVAAQLRDCLRLVGNSDANARPI
jgi:hypothetical protein